MKNHQFSTSCLGQMLLLVCIYKRPGHLVAEKTESVRKDLTAFMRICKSINTLSEPLLYTEILITWDDCLKPKPSIELLLRTLLERPNLASLIKRIRFRNGLDPAARPANHQLSQDVLDLARNSIRLDRFPSSDTWIQGMQEGSVPIIVAFLLSRLHKIVDWGGAYEKGEHWGIKGSLGSLTDLAHLKSIEVPIVVLLGWVVSSSAPQLADILPRTLRQLLLRNDLNYFYKYEWDQQACLDRLSEYLGRLKTDAVILDGITVRLRDCPPEDRWDQDEKKKLELLCSEAGVSCTFDPSI